MINNLIGPDIVLARKRYDEALNLQGINIPSPNNVFL